ncbi:hypothetical protein LTS18_001982 [Coniosporium uncinatum]|uniref:Uncharacterized protein n=1 Tax=Coniosporium uncinatum TaxID=93489 RepID=A0ACC3D7V1_9PEZI|nr:hypothetical protein LTS18_001982 [Coniosporium uncinatum]
MAQPAHDESLSLLTRLSQKPGVQSTLILSRDTGAIVRTSGLISESPATNPNSAPPAPAENGADPFTNGTTNGAKEKGMNSAEDIARIVWNYVKATESMIKELNGDDDARLLRVRTKRNELVIVPGMVTT